MSAFQEPNFFAEFFVKLVKFGIVQHSRHVFSDLFELVVDRAGFGFRAVIQAESAAGEDLVTIDGSYNISDGALEGFFIQVKAAGGTFEGEK